MVKKELFKTEIDYDSFDELADEIVKSPKKAKKASKLDDTPSPDSKLKRARAGGNTKREWTAEEEEELIECLGEVIATNLAQAVKERPLLAARSATGCLRHWIAWRRKLETSILGAPTVDGNGKKIVKPDVARDDSA